MPAAAIRPTDSDDPAKQLHILSPDIPGPFWTEARCEPLLRRAWTPCRKTTTGRSFPMNMRIIPVRLKTCACLGISTSPRFSILPNNLNLSLFWFLAIVRWNVLSFDAHITKIVINSLCQPVCFAPLSRPYRPTAPVGPVTHNAVLTVRNRFRPRNKTLNKRLPSCFAPVCV